MNMTEYQRLARKTAVYPGFGDRKLESILYCVVGLVNEAGEVAGKVKKVMRGDMPLDRARDKIADEAADTLWYLAMLCSELNITLEDLAERNIDKLMYRLHSGKIRGDGDDR